MIVLNLITMNIIIAVLNSRYSILTHQFSREKYEQWLTKCLSDFIFNRNMIRGGRCRAFLLHVRDFERSTAAEKLQLRLMIAAEAFITRKNTCVRSLTRRLPPTLRSSLSRFPRYLRNLNPSFRWLHPMSWVGDWVEDWFRCSFARITAIT